MKHLSIPGSCLMAFALTASPALSDEILIYKYSSARPWVEYTCLRPDAAESTAAAPIVPKNTLTGTYTATEYWIVNKTKKEYSKIYYQAKNFRGTVEKTYTWDEEPSPFTRTDDSTPETPVTVPTYHSLPAKAANTYNISIHFGYRGAYSWMEGTGFTTEQGNLQGLGKPFPLTKTTFLQGVAPVLKGPYISSYRNEFSVMIGEEATPARTLYFEKSTTHTLTLDTKATQKANIGTALVPFGGGAPVTSGSIPYGIRVVGLQLEAIGYDFSTGYGS